MDTCAEAIGHRPYSCSRQQISLRGSGTASLLWMLLYRKALCRLQHTGQPRKYWLTSCMQACGSLSQRWWPWRPPGESEIWFPAQGTHTAGQSRSEEACSPAVRSRTNSTEETMHDSLWRVPEESDAYHRQRAAFVRMEGGQEEHRDCNTDQQDCTGSADPLEQSRSTL